MQYPNAKAARAALKAQGYVWSTVMQVWHIPGTPKTAYIENNIVYYADGVA